MELNDLIKTLWMPHPGHFIGSMECRFRLNTYVNGYIVSTVGEYTEDPYEEGKSKWKSLGYSSNLEPMHYETMYFKARKSKEKCCPYEAIVTGEENWDRHKTAEEALKGHYKRIKEIEERNGTE